MKLTRLCGPLSAVLGLVLGISCTNDYDPFTDLSQARAVVTHMSFHSPDTLSIFTTETLSVEVAVSELVDSFSINVPSNRRGPDTVVVRKSLGQPIAPGPYTYLFSLTDTGENTVTITTYRRNGDRIPQDYSLYLRNPLHQNPIGGEYGAMVRLATPPVGDSDVVYHWKFGDGIVFTSPVPTDSVAVKMQPLDSTAGLLWVTDLSGAHSSPGVAFSYNLMDTTGPVILCESDGYIGKDTIITGDTTFYFKVKIWDSTQTFPIQSASIGGHPFDIAEDPYYIGVFSHMDTTSRMFPVTVTAVSNPQFLVTSRKTFWLQFNGALPHGSNVQLLVTDPPTPTSVVESPAGEIFGYVEDYAQDSFSVIVRMWLNNATSPLSDTVTAHAYKASWGFNFPLVTGADSVRLGAYALNGDWLAADSLLIVYDPSAKDTEPPVIVEVTANGAPASVPFVASDTVVLSIIAFDQGSGIDSLSVNSREVAKSPSGYGFIWLDTVTVTHSSAGTPFVIVAVDNAKNRDSVTYSLIQNRPPQIRQAPPARDTVMFGNTFAANIYFADPDNDPVTVSLSAGPPGMTVSSVGQISWIPNLPSDTGTKIVRINLSDGYQSIADSFEVFVTSLGSLPPEVQIDTAAMAIPRYLEADMDSLTLSVKTKNDSGNMPLTYAVALSNVNLPMTGNLCVWRPGAADAGPQLFTISVSDTFRRTVSWSFLVTVEPANRPCTLLVHYTVPVLPDGELDLSAATQPDTLSFSVDDPDLPAVEQHTVVVEFASGKTQFTLDSTDRFIVTLPSKTPNGQSSDTLLVTVTDRAGHADSLRFAITYAGEGFTGKIYINTLTSGANITGMVTGFPLLVRLDKSYFDFSQTQQLGQDIRFVKPNGVALPYEIEQWDNVSGTAEIWVKVDTIRPLNDSQYIRMTWGNAAAVDSSNGSAVFDTEAGYMGVWHMSDGSSTQNANSVHARNSATVVQQTAASAIIPCAGAIGGGDSLADNYLSVGQLPYMPRVSVSAWVNPVALPSFAKIITKEWTDYAVPYQVYSLEIDAPGDSLIQFHVGLSQLLTGYATSNDSLKLNSWTHVVGTYDGTTIRLYVNGVDAADYTWQLQSVPAVPDPQTAWTIGGWDLKQTESFHGAIDEARIYNGVWSADYIKLSYENQRSGSTVLTFK